VSRFHLLRTRTRFRRCRVCRVPFSCFELPDSFSAVSSVSGPVFMFCAPELIFGGTEGDESGFHALRVLTRFRRYRGRREPFSCFARPYSFSTAPKESCPVFMLCAPGLIFGGTEGVWSIFNVLSSHTRFRRLQRASGPIFMFSATGLVFGGTEGVGSRFHILPARTRFWRCRGRRVPYSCFARRDSFSAV
jgi:hypothetical protein